MGTDPALLSPHRRETCASPSCTPQLMTPRVGSCPQSVGTLPRMSGELGSGYTPDPNIPNLVVALRTDMGRHLLAVIRHLETGHLPVAGVPGACAISTGLALPLLTPCPTHREPCVHILHWVSPLS